MVGLRVGKAARGGRKVAHCLGFALTLGSRDRNSLGSPGALSQALPPPGGIARPGPTPTPPSRAPRRARPPRVRSHG